MLAEKSGHPGKTPLPTSEGQLQVGAAHAARARDAVAAHRARAPVAAELQQCALAARLTFWWGGGFVFSSQVV